MIRPITQKDKAVFLILAKAFYSSPAVAHTIPTGYHTATFDQLMKDDTYAQCFMIEHGSKVVGYALLAKTFSQEAGGIVIWVEELFILPEYRNKGLGKEFFAFIKETFEPHVARIRLEVEPDNTNAIRLYKQMGFDVLPYQQMVKECK